MKKISSVTDFQNLLCDPSTKFEEYASHGLTSETSKQQKLEQMHQTFLEYTRYQKSANKKSYNNYDSSWEISEKLVEYVNPENLIVSTKLSKYILEFSRNLSNFHEISEKFSKLPKKLQLSRSKVIFSEIFENSGELTDLEKYRFSIQLINSKFCGVFSEFLHKTIHSSSREAIRNTLLKHAIFSDSLSIFTDLLSFWNIPEDSLFSCRLVSKASRFEKTCSLLTRSILEGANKITEFITAKSTLQEKMQYLEELITKYSNEFQLDSNIQEQKQRECFKFVCEEAIKEKQKQLQGKQVSDHFRALFHNSKVLAWVTDPIIRDNTLTKLVDIDGAFSEFSKAMLLSHEFRKNASPTLESKFISQLQKINDSEKYLILFEICQASPVIAITLLQNREILENITESTKTKLVYCLDTSTLGTEAFSAVLSLGVDLRPIAREILSQAFLSRDREFIKQVYSEYLSKTGIFLDPQYLDPKTLNEITEDATSYQTKILGVIEQCRKTGLDITEVIKLSENASIMDLVLSGIVTTLDELKEVSKEKIASKLKL